MGISPDLLVRIRGEFLEMPGLKLTPDQARRLWNLNQAQCGDALDALIADGFLLRTPSGAFIAVPSATKMVKASVSPPAERERCPHCQHLNSLPHTDSVRARAVLTTYRCAACSRIVNMAAASA